MLTWKSRQVWTDKKAKAVTRKNKTCVNVRWKQERKRQRASEKKKGCSVSSEFAASSKWRKTNEQVHWKSKQRSSASARKRKSRKWGSQGQVVSETVSKQMRDCEKITSKVEVTERRRLRCVAQETKQTGQSAHCAVKRLKRTVCWSMTFRVIRMAQASGLEWSAQNLSEGEWEGSYRFSRSAYLEEYWNFEYDCTCRTVGY